MVTIPDPVAWRVNGGPWRSDGITGALVDIPGPLSMGDMIEVAWDDLDVAWDDSMAACYWVDVGQPVGPDDVLRIDQTKIVVT